MPVRRDHAALALLPFALALRQPSKSAGPVEFTYELEVAGRPQRISVTLTPREGSELPVHGDQLVYLALLPLGLRQPEPPRRIQFERPQVLDLLRWEPYGRNAQCWVEWGSLVLEAYNLKDFKRLDWEPLVALDNPLTVQLYRLLDRITLTGQTQWQVDWRALTQSLGMNLSAYQRPARLKQVLQPHFE